MNHTPAAQKQRNPLEIPEIVHHLGRFIGCPRYGTRDYRDLFRSLLVCKTWYHALLQSMYEVQLETGMSRWRGPSYTGAPTENHRHFVRMLDLRHRPPDLHFPNLQFLIIRYLRDETLNSYTPFLERHATHIRKIVLVAVRLDNSHEFAVVLGQMPKLTELVLSNCHLLFTQWRDKLLKMILLCQRVEHLSMYSITLHSSPPLTLQPSTKLVHLTNLRLFKIDAEFVATMVSHCPSLKTLSWTIKTDRRHHKSDHHLRAIVQAIQQCCSKLEHIEDLELFRGAEGEDAWFLADLVRSVKRLRTFTTTYNYHIPWYHDLLTALLAHKDTLEVIKIPNGTISPWMRIKCGYRIDTNMALLPSTTVSVPDITDDTCEQESSWSLPPITTACSKQPSVVSTLLYQCSRLRIVELPYVGLEHFGAFSKKYGDQAWKCRASLQQFTFTRAQRMVHLLLERLSSHKNANPGSETDIDDEVVAGQLQVCHLTEEGNGVNHNTVKAERVRAMMDDLAQQLELCPRLRLFSVRRQESLDDIMLVY